MDVKSGSPAFSSSVSQRIRLLSDKILSLFLQASFTLYRPPSLMSGTVPSGIISLMSSSQAAASLSSICCGTGTSKALAVSIIR